MSTSKVYFTDLRAKNGDNLLQKLQRLIKTAGIGNIDFENKYVAIKIHLQHAVCRRKEKCPGPSGQRQSQWL